VQLTPEAATCSVNVCGVASTVLEELPPPPLPLIVKVLLPMVIVPVEITKSVAGEPDETLHGEEIATQVVPPTETAPVFDVITRESEPSFCTTKAAAALVIEERDSVVEEFEPVAVTSTLVTDIG
jgi:hypothetical protein